MGRAEKGESDLRGVLADILERSVGLLQRRENELRGCWGRTVWASVRALRQLCVWHVEGSCLRRRCGWNKLRGTAIGKELGGEWRTQSLGDLRVL